MTQIDRVWQEYKLGSRTTEEVSALTGLSVNYVASYTNRLVKRGKLVKSGIAEPVKGFGHGRQKLFYSPVLKIKIGKRKKL